MLIEKNVVIKKFAIAFLNNYENKINKEYIKNLEELIKYLRKNKILKAVISRPSLSKEKKDEIINLIAQKLNIPGEIKKLVFVLLNRGEIDLFIEIIRKIVSISKQKAGIHKFNVSTSHELEEKEKNKIIKFLSSSIVNSVEINFEIDRSLISGIKIKSQTMLLENSASKKMKEFRKTLQREEIW